MNPQHVRCTVVGPCGIHTRYGKRNTQHDRTTTAKAAHTHTHSHTQRRRCCSCLGSLWVVVLTVCSVFSALHCAQSTATSTPNVDCAATAAKDPENAAAAAATPAGKLLRRRRRRHGKISLLIFCNCHSDVARPVCSSACE